MVEGGGGGDVAAVAVAEGSPAAAIGRGGVGGRRYGVRAAEVAMHRALNVIRVEVVLLDDSPHVFEIQKQAKGQALLDLVFSHLELLERAYFGLQYRDTRCPPSQPDRRWLDPLKTVKKQLRIHSRTIDTCELPVLYFRVKFWVTDPGRLTEEYTRYHVTLQLRRLLVDGSLPAPDTTAALLASYALQSDFGDYSVTEHGTDYLKEAELLPPVPPHMLPKVIELHKLHKGQTPADAEFQFLRHAKRLELYGVDLHAAKDSCDRDLSVGVTSSGLVVIMNGVRMNTFSWAKIIKISFKRRQFMIQLRREMVNGGDAEFLHRQTAIVKPASFLQSIRNKVWGKCELYESILVFTLPSYRACKCLWKSCVEHHTFFRLHTPRPPPRRQLLGLGSKFWYSGRTQHQTLEEAKRTLASSPSVRTFVRSPSKQASLATLATNGAAAVSGASSSNGSSQTTKRGLTASAGSQGARGRSDSCGYRVTSLPSTPKLAWTEGDKPARPPPLNGSSGDGSKDDTTEDVSSSLVVTSVGDRPCTPARLPSVLSLLPSSAAPSPLHSSIASSKTPSKESSIALPSVLCSSNASSYPAVASSSLAPLAAHEGDLPSSSSSASSKSSSSSASDSDTAAAIAELQGGASEESEHGLITIRIQPDTVGKFAGKFGFNVKGGADQDAPVLVSKVTAGSPADTCFPRLNEGDQVLLINGREVSSMTHDQVVNSIKASRECHSGELVLTVKQNVYEGDEGERDIEYVPENGAQASDSFSYKSPLKLEESMLRLHQELKSGELVAKFETRYRINPNLPMDIARWSCNETRNRYRDISPYDKTRVVLRDDGSESPFNDYINASFVDMEITGTKIVNKYIASQGPLSTTCGHFWLMVWQQHCLLLVMLTTCVEQGRTKCRQYWPEVNCSADYGAISVRCDDEQKTKSGFIWRQFTVKHKSSEEKRKIQHLQYVTWPDHGVPEHSNDFLTFVQEVRRIRAEDRENQYPVLVHCSAGIGRTGVLILMETSQCLIEANQPLFPENLVMKMRDQRPMMIQTSGQFRFVCEAIHRVYDEKLIRPLELDSSR